MRARRNVRHSSAKQGACAQYRAHDGRLQRGTDVACANFGDFRCHGVRKIAAGHRAGAPLPWGNHLGRQHAGKRRIMPDSRCCTPLTRLGAAARLSNLFTVREETRERRRSEKRRFSPRNDGLNNLRRIRDI